jgi:lipopolysaccharide transport system ATP-binding protein
MYVRLAFAVAAHLEPEILIVDEVLAVGDAEFQKKCLGKMGEVAKGGRTVLFVSHNLGAVETLCGSCVSLQSGSVFRIGSTAEVVGAYLSSFQRAAQGTIDLEKISNRRGNGTLKFARLSFLNAGGEIIDRPTVGEYLVIQLELSGTATTRRPARVSVNFASCRGENLFLCDTGAAYLKELQLGSGDIIRCVIPNLPLSEGFYQVGVFIERAGVVEDWLDGSLEMEVAPGDFFGSGRNCPRGWEGRVVLVNHHWYPSGSLLLGASGPRAEEFGAYR